MKPITNVVGFDDAPFRRDGSEPVRVIGAVCARTRLDGVLSGWVARNGEDATSCLADLIEGSQFVGYVRAVLLKGIAVAGFNVVDIHTLAERLAVPVLVVVRRLPDYAAMRNALECACIDANERWRRILRAGRLEPAHGLFVQRAGLSLAEAEALLRATTLHGKLPEPLRVAHLIAGGVTRGASRGRA